MMLLRNSTYDILNFDVHISFEARWTLPLTDVIAARYGTEWSQIPEHYGENGGQRGGGAPMMTTLGPPRSFVLHYAARGVKNKWSHHIVTMSHDDPRQIQSWVVTLRNCLASEYCETITLRLHFFFLEA